MSTEYVYVILDQQQFAVKIGYSCDPIKRLSALQTAHCRSELRLLNLFEGGKEQESFIHRQLAKYRLKGEWFDFTSYVKQYLLDMQKSIYDQLEISPFSTDHLNIDDFCRNYLAESTTKKRTRVAMKELKANFHDFSLKELKSIMIALGYHEWKDTSGSIYFYPKNSEKFYSTEE